jgi:hypothetical protein
MKLSAICAVSVGMAIAVLVIPNVSAQQKCKMSWEVPASDTKYTQQLAIDVGDMPGHQVPSCLSERQAELRGAEMDRILGARL